MYNNPSCSGLDEFQEDLLRIKYTKRLLHRYVRTNEMPIRLVCNHIIGINNVFQPHSVARLLFFKIDESAYSALKTVLEYLSLMPDEVLLIDGSNILNINIEKDNVLWDMIIEAVEPYGKTN